MYSQTAAQSRREKIQPFLHSCSCRDELIQEKLLETRKQTFSSRCRIFSPPIPHPSWINEFSRPAFKKVESHIWAHNFLCTGLYNIAGWIILKQNCFSKGVNVWWMITLESSTWSGCLVQPTCCHSHLITHAISTSKTAAHLTDEHTQEEAGRAVTRLFDVRKMKFKAMFTRRRVFTKKEYTFSKTSMLHVMHIHTNLHICY